MINKYDLWLKEDEENPHNWVVMNKEQLEELIGRSIERKESAKGRAIIDYDDIVWKKFL